MIEVGVEGRDTVEVVVVVEGVGEVLGSSFKGSVFIFKSYTGCTRRTDLWCESLNSLSN